MRIRRFKPVLSLMILLVLGGCSVTKNLKPNEYLLIKNDIRIKDAKISEDDLSGYLQQTPNTKLFGMFRSNIAIYTLGSKGKETKFKKFLRDKVGSAPVLLDTSLNAISRKQMKLFLNNKGYFQSQVEDSVHIKKKKAIVYYRVRGGKPYTYRSVSYNIHDTLLAREVFRDTANSLIKRGANYDAYILDNERTRITNYLLNEGYYHFTTNFVVFRLDSNLESHQMNVIVEITNPVVPSLTEFGTVVETTHKRYYIHDIYIYPTFDHLKADTLAYDTLKETYATPYKNRLSSTYYFLHNGPFSPKPRILATNILVETDSVYNLKDVSKTYSQLTGLQVFKYVNISFTDILPPPGSEHKDLLDCKVKLSKSPPNSFSFSTEGTNSAGALGISGSVGFSNRNLFKGAEIFKISLNGSTQMQVGGTGPSGLFNTVEFGVNSTLTFPQFLIPIKPEKLPKEFKPKTILTLGYNFQNNRSPEYVRHLVNASFGYAWIQDQHLSHQLNPIELLFVKVFPSQAFLDTLNSLQDNRLKNQYTSHMVQDIRYTLTYSNQVINKDKNFWYIRSNFMTGGNLLYGITSLIDGPKDQYGSYTIAGIPFAEFVKPDLDMRYYFMLKSKRQFVTRFYGGIGVPYGNSNVLPYEEAFMAGGSNDMRGWKLGALGPGIFYNDSVSQSLGQVGDIQLQVDLEYRFPIYSFFRGAVFSDIGNIWLLYPSPDFPGGQFQFVNFLSELGVDVGVGIRLDFDFFIFRLDPAIPIKMPSYPADNHWYFSKLQLKDILWNFGIGYPF